MRADIEVHGVAGGDMVNYSISVESEARSSVVETGGRRSVSRFGHWGERKQKLSGAWRRPAEEMT